MTASAGRMQKGEANSKGFQKGEEIHCLMGKIYRMVMLQSVNCVSPPVNFFTEINIRSPDSKFESSAYDQDYAAEKLSGF